MNTPQHEVMLRMILSSSVMPKTKTDEVTVLRCGANRSASRLDLLGISGLVGSDDQVPRALDFVKLPLLVADNAGSR